MAEHPSPSSDMPLARSVLNKLTETVDNLKLHSLPLLSLYEQWKSVQSSFAMAETSMKSRAKKLKTDERRVESMLTEIRVREESVKECWEFFEAKNKEIEERIVEVGIRVKEYDERFKILQFNEKVVNGDLDVKVKRIRELGEALEVKKTGFSEELRVFEARERRFEEECRCLEAKEKGMVEEMENFESKKKGMVNEFRDLEAKEKGMVEEMENFESKKKGMVNEFRNLEERERRVEESFRGFEVREKEMKELEELLGMRAKEIVEECRVLEERRKAVDGTSQGLDERSKEVELREKELVVFQRKLELKEKDIDKGFETCCEELRLKKDELVESHRVLGLKESEIVEKCKELELKQEVMNEQLKETEVKENDKRMILVNERDVDFTKTVEPSTMDGFSDDNAPHRQLSVAVKEKQVEDGCSVPGVKEVISENPQADNFAVAGVVASRLSAEIELVFRNDDARATASYLTEPAETVSMWQKNILDLREEITGLLECLIAESKHLQAAMCTCVFKMKDVYSPEFLLNAHLAHVRQRAEEIVKKASGTAQVIELARGNLGRNKAQEEDSKEERGGKDEGRP